MHNQRMPALGEILSEVPRSVRVGRIVSTRGSLLVGQIPNGALGEKCLVSLKGSRVLETQIVGFDGDYATLAPFDYIDGVSPGACVRSTGKYPSIKISDALIGKVVDAFGNPLDGGEIAAPERAISAPPPDPLTRKPITQALTTGVRALDALCTIGYGQRLGLFAGAGAGKSTLLGMIARDAAVDLSVIALVGERGREVSEFINDSLGEMGLKRSIVVVSTSDQSPIKRQLGVETATAIAEYFRDKGKRVLLLVDSLTRAARAIRDVSLSAGEIPVRQGYTTSVYTQLPRLLERAGNNMHGSITAIYTVLTAGTDENDPLGEELKSILDGHIVLDPKLAELGIRPSIHSGLSISRLFNKLNDQSHIKSAVSVLKALARLRKDKDLLLFGGVPDEELRKILAVETELWNFLMQAPNEKSTLEQSKSWLSSIAMNLA